DGSEPAAPSRPPTPTLPAPDPDRLDCMTMDDGRWEPGMPVLDRQAVRPTTLPPSLQGLPPRSVPEVAPHPLQRHYINLSVIVLICGAVAITALNLGARLGDPLIKACVIVAAPLLVVTTA